MNYFSPRDQGNQNGRSSGFTSDNRRASDPYSDRDSRFRGGFRDRRGDDRRAPRQDFQKSQAQQYLPPMDNVLYQAADNIDPANIDYSFYDVPVKVHHARDQPDVPAYSEFAEFMEIMPAWLQKNIQRMKYQKLTPIQQHSVPIGTSGYDVLATAQTGSGKSAAFFIPIFLNIAKQNMKTLTNSPTTYFAYNRNVARPFVIVLSPTRELALQNATAAWQLSNNSGILTRVCYGGESSRVQSAVLQNGCDILVSTPGRLKDFLQQGVVDCRYVKYFILDEADVMLDFGFVDDIKEIRNIMLDHQKARTENENEIIGRLQTSLFSATFPKEIQNISREFLTNPYHIQIGEIGVTGMNITQVLLKATKNTKMDFIKYLSSKTGQMLIFCKTKASVDFLAQQLKAAFYQKTTGQVNEEIKTQIDQMFDYLQRQVAEQTPQSVSTPQKFFEAKDVDLDSGMVGAIHGDLSQAERTANLGAFRSQRLKILIATDVAQRGLDLPKVDYVINYDMPAQIEDYSHRIGRTGRAGRRGCSITLVTDDESKSIMKDLVAKLSECNQLIPAWYDDMLRTKWTMDRAYSKGRRSGGGNSRGGDRGGRPQGGDRQWGQRQW
ncbi:ATP-dependent_RNA helicase [Hexamita inflata]|uniref:ATP-dependent RNA helicase n=1 Tax=Hexamita inflata TaxID=28002 RepID=A0AA86PEH7_9EUKA|nr:ATP-dependent RNA helicase [Hexamita inflata]